MFTTTIQAALLSVPHQTEESVRLITSKLDANGFNSAHDLADGNFLGISEIAMRDTFKLDGAQAATVCAAQKKQPGLCPAGSISGLQKSINQHQLQQRQSPSARPLVDALTTKQTEALPGEVELLKAQLLEKLGSAMGGLEEDELEGLCCAGYLTWHGLEAASEATLAAVVPLRPSMRAMLLEKIQPATVVEPTPAFEDFWAKLTSHWFKAPKQSTELEPQTTSHCTAQEGARTSGR